MILSEVKGYLLRNRRAALRDMAQHFKVEPDALRGMLSRWLQKGQLRRLPMGTPCEGSCCKCDPLIAEIYEWVD